MNDDDEQSDPNRSDAKIDLSAEALAHLGDGRIAYVKTIRSEDVRAMFPQAEMPELAPGRTCSRCMAPTARRSC